MGLCLGKGLVRCLASTRVYVLELYFKVVYGQPYCYGILGGASERHTFLAVNQTQGSSRDTESGL